MRKITLGHLSINDQGKAYVNYAMDNNRLSAGVHTRAFEKLFAHKHDVAHAIFCNSGTSALQISLAAMKEYYGWQDGDEVIVPATTFIATSNVVIQNNLKPVFVDVDPLTFNIDPWLIEKAVTSRTRCIIPVHLFGLPADMQKINLLAIKHGLRVLEDSCEAVLSTQDRIPVGSFGDMACFSTYVSHFVVGGIGGIVTTNNSTLEKICRSLMAHGRDSIYTNIDADDKIDSHIIERRFKFERVGYSYRATELEAAIALSELERIEDNIAIRRYNANLLTRLLLDINGLQLPSTPTGRTHSFMMYPIVLSERFDRDKLLLHMEKNGIETRYLFPLLTQPVYARMFPGEAEKHPISKRLGERGFFIGMHQGLSISDIVYISGVLHYWFEVNR